MRLLASKVGRAWTLAALAAGTAHAADIIVSAQDGKFVRVDGVATYPEPAPRDSLVVLDASRFPPVLKATVDIGLEHTVRRERSSTPSCRSSTSRPRRRR